MSTILITRHPKSTRVIRYTNSLDAERQINDLTNFTPCNGEYDAATGHLTLNSADGHQLVLVEDDESREGESTSRLRTCNILVMADAFSSTSAAIAATFGRCEPDEDPVRRSFQFTKSDQGTIVVWTSYITKEEMTS